MHNKFDLIVAGGGFAGAAAAIAAAREGLSVMIFDRNNCFGGAASECLVNPFMYYWTNMSDENKTRVNLCRGIFEEIVNNLKKIGGMPDDCSFNEEYLKLVLNRMILAENITVLFNSYLSGVKTENGYVRGVILSNKSGNEVYYADYFIDATGDGDLAAMCGCPYSIGRPEDGLCQPMTLCFRVGNVDIEKFKSEKEEINRLYSEYQKKGLIKNTRENVLTFFVPAYGVVHFNSTRIVKKSPVNAKEITEAEIEAREQVFELFNFIKDNFSSFKNAQLLTTAIRTGVRESRMITGRYVLNQDDLISCRKFDDAIAVGNYDIDIHNPSGSGTSHYYFGEEEYYSIPYRCITPLTTKNLLVAGRCISSTHEAQASYRIMPICCCLGQAAGTAAAAAKEQGSDVNSIDVKALQRRLKKNGAIYE